MAAELPGFYYDETRRKYFKIQANHVVPHGSGYSTQAIQKRKAQEQQVSIWPQLPS